MYFHLTKTKYDNFDNFQMKAINSIIILYICKLKLY